MYAVLRILSFGFFFNSSTSLERSAARVRSFCFLSIACYYVGLIRFNLCDNANSKAVVL